LGLAEGGAYTLIPIESQGRFDYFIKSPISFHSQEANVEILTANTINVGVYAAIF